MPLKPWKQWCPPILVVPETKAVLNWEVNCLSLRQRAWPTCGKTGCTILTATRPPPRPPQTVLSSCCLLCYTRRWTKWCHWYDICGKCNKMQFVVVHPNQNCCLPCFDRGIWINLTAVCWWIFLKNHWCKVQYWSHESSLWSNTQDVCLLPTNVFIFNRHPWTMSGTQSCGFGWKTFKKCIVVDTCCVNVGWNFLQPTVTVCI